MDKKILHVVNIYFVLPYFIGEQFKYFANKGYSQYVICSPSEYLEGFAKENKFRYKEVPILRSISPIRDLLSIISICKFIKENNIDIVVGHTPKGALLAMCASFIMRVPKRIYFRHGLVYETSKGLNKQIMIFIEKFTSFLSTKVICVSPYLIEKSINDKLTNNKKIDILNIGSCNGVDALCKFNPDLINENRLIELRKQIRINDNSFVIGYSGRLVKDKGIVELVDAFKKLCLVTDNIFLLLVGPLEIRDSLPKEIIEEIESNDKIISTGLIHDDIEYYYSLMSILILPTHREGLGTCILEASSMGKPVLTTSHTGSRDAIKNNLTGMYIDMNAEDIYNKILHYIKTPELINKHGRNGRDFVLSNFQQHLIWREIEKKIYQ